MTAGGRRNMSEELRNYISMYIACANGYLLKKKYNLIAQNE